MFLLITCLVAVFIDAQEYTIEAIPFNNPAPFTRGTSVSVGTDDVYSSAIPLPFYFFMVKRIRRWL